MAEGRKLIRERNVEAIFTAPYGYEFTAAAYELAMEFGLEFFIFETDEWDQNNATIPLGLRRVRAEHATVLRAATKRWFTSPAMVRVMKEKFGVDGDFLFHFVDTAHYAAARERVSPPSDRIVIIYTGSINVMFEQTMKPFCDWLNAGVTIEGLPVEMVIYTHLEPKIYMGPHVRWGGFVAIEEIATKLAEAHVATVLVSFADDPMTQQMIRTSLYTKTIDYLAAGTPTLVVSPPYSAEVDYFGGVTEVVDTLDFARIEHALRSMALDDAHRTELRLRGEELVAGRHSMQALQRIFLRYFERAGS